MNPLIKWCSRVFNNPSLMALLLFGCTLSLAFFSIGQWLIPVIISAVIAYLLEGLIKKCEKNGVRRIFAVSVVFLLFSFLIIYIFIGVLPILINQAKGLITNLPVYLSYAQEKMHILPKRFPEIISQQDIDLMLGSMNAAVAEYTKILLSKKIFESLFAVFTVLVYIILIPILIFFFLKDKVKILSWLGQFLPDNHQIIQDIWTEVDIQIGNYIRGKFVEVMIIWIMCFIPFNILGLQYSLLLSLMVGLSVLIPYIGATIVTFPVLIVAYMQFGLNSGFWWSTGFYFVVQVLDGNVIVPVIFSEAVSIHPIAIIMAVLVFGGLWGFWGIFFAIPLATLVKAIVEAWRRYQNRGQ